ncbi:putative DNA-directed RNA polymerase [Helianthus annuus]|uniref:DNA-directed RNA polymerase n=1 Tax=Helianthus annuus TaxID=4232 RepID=A0A9K3IVD5_HELAN|nr:putative DNA-directed RNA polymerase [Helianthus annuus]KAJ0560870.1 putative DNA-directed RNA polymerase [Helianthus annuus]KAJ0567330.1 putative DNA-directed RNA polymerase [Helianthus annuus]KAJ0573910.1 putative DNA-directed RNA polymerase [Helianthus annuus]KAJ0738244.1 putative DNA-directed RNA polymerase [Helianthus annuus]
MQEIVDESAEIEIRPESQHNPGHQPDFAEVRFGSFKFRVLSLADSSCSENCVDLVGFGMK